MPLYTITELLSVGQSTKQTIIADNLGHAQRLAEGMQKHSNSALLVEDENGNMLAAKHTSNDKWTYA